MSKTRPERPPLFERLKKGLEELSEDARGEIALRTTTVEVPAPVAYDPYSDVLRIQWEDATIEQKKEAASGSGVTLFYDAQNNVIGVELRQASHRVKLPMPGTRG